MNYILGIFIHGEASQIPRPGESETGPRRLSIPTVNVLQLPFCQFSSATECLIFPGRLKDVWNSCMIPALPGAARHKLMHSGRRQSPSLSPLRIWSEYRLEVIRTSRSSNPGRSFVHSEWTLLFWLPQIAPSSGKGWVSSNSMCYDACFDDCSVRI